MLGGVPGRSMHWWHPKVFCAGPLTFASSLIHLETY
jgi:hypothetical protein